MRCAFARWPCWHFLDGAALRFDLLPQLDGLPADKVHSELLLEFALITV